MPDGVDEITVMQWQVHTPEVILTGQQMETKICTLKLHRDFKRKDNVLVYRVQAPPEYERISYGNVRTLGNNKEYALISNVHSVKIRTTPRYSPQQIDSFNEIRSNPGNYLSPDEKDYFHDWMNPHRLEFEIEIREDRRLSNVLGFRSGSQFSVSGKFIIDNLSVKPKFVDNF
ncbi:MAG: hypothetical protein ACQESP_13315 [Candidatus Muiribacteriota bacterium]